MVRSTRNTPTSGSRRANTPASGTANHANSVAAGTHPFHPPSFCINLRILGNTSNTQASTAPAAPPTASAVVNSSAPVLPSAPAAPAIVPAIPANALARPNPNLVSTGLPNPSLFDRSYYDPNKRKFYLVTVGRELGMHPDWQVTFRSTLDSP
ncbi:hypothetical protein CVT26_015000 [Gymnopilus dilepis]|uniref:Uncharacterized protein n=1 Tax=Gymnopilus dilepis TaxID=231916 RepID=A0A409XA19_9AGAR|nr:hypothetical protein CVT26_015000 [Gymnopilus dilepis]